MGKRHPLWLLLFPEGTIVSDEERCKSVKYAEREGIVSPSQACVQVLIPTDPIGRPTRHAPSSLDGSVVLLEDSPSGRAGPSATGLDDWL